MDWFTLLPPAIAIIIALWKKDVILALLGALFCADTLLNGFNLALGFLAVFDSIVAVFASSGNTRILIFSLLIGALLSLIKKSGGVSAFVSWVCAKGLADSQRKVASIPAIIGVLIFIETNLSLLTAGFISRNLFDQVKLSRARLAYIIDSTCAPVCVIILFNAWGATLLALLDGYQLQNPVQSLINSIGYNFYAWITLVLVFYTVWSGRVFGAMKRSELKNTGLQDDSADNSDSQKISLKDHAYDKKASGHIGLMLIPLLTMIFSIVFFMWYTGNGELLKGSGTQSVLWAVGLACVVAFIMIRLSSERTSTVTLIKWGFEGMVELLPLVITVMLALALGASMKMLGTGTFVSSMVSDSLPIWSLPALIFLCASIISFTTGTSWGTFGILIPIAVPIALINQIPPEIVISAVVGGGVFGDHCSPISDTTIVSSLAAGCDHLEHVKTQLPYALFAGVISVVAYLLVGLLG